LLGMGQYLLELPLSDDCMDIVLVDDQPGVVPDFSDIVL